MRVVYNGKGTLANFARTALAQVHPHPFSVMFSYLVNNWAF